eukprot:CAMPEP_0118965132 /NCGR_PEP_ID=MMETSP1173-20130426/2724_1 /TAXON_ID=1034831 /ORGANISM="Rhizochromulina marina cf, Strain CCMP1243" /LENGTH=451 /DNA_ID=CAMNT_0006913701 /DNA_START=40 /DNA_END=1395 /DNA_ORIENTATION=-
MSHFVRASKYRHIFVEAPKTEQIFHDIRLSSTTGEQQYIKANAKFFAVGLVGGGGPVGIIPHDKPGRMPPTMPTISGHKGSTFDFEFNPFHDHIISTGSDDTTIKVWGIPEGGLTENVTTPLVDMHGHGRKVTLLKSHPTASNVLASASADHTVKLWDIEKGKNINTFEGHPDNIQDIAWDYTGRLYATSCKDKVVRIIDARGAEEAFTIPQAHDGAKSVKLIFLGTKEKICSFGFTRQSMRVLKIWDPRSLDKPLNTLSIDQAAGVFMPHYDADTNVLYAAGKGDGNIRYYECVDENPFIFPLSDYRSTQACKGVCFLPKRALDVMRCETARALKLTSNSVEPLSFIVPRKSDAFQSDIYPPTFAGMPSHTADEWLAGADKPPVLVSVDPSDNGKIVENTAAASSGIQIRTKAQIENELKAALERIQLLEKTLDDNGIAVPGAAAAEASS